MGIRNRMTYKKKLGKLSYLAIKKLKKSKSFWSYFFGGDKLNHLPVFYEHCELNCIWTLWWSSWNYGNINKTRQKQSVHCQFYLRSVRVKLIVQFLAWKSKTDSRLYVCFYYTLCLALTHAAWRFLWPPDCTSTTCCTLLSPTLEALVATGGPPCSG